MVLAGQKFAIDTSVNVLGGNETSITAIAPSFKAGVDGVFNLDNEFFGKVCGGPLGCLEDSVDKNINGGRFGLIGVDTTEDNFLRVGGGEKGAGSLGVPGIGFDKEYVFYRPTPENPDGVDDDVTPKKTPSPRWGDFMISNLQDLTGGTVVSGDNVTFQTNQQFLSLNYSITGLAETLLGGGPGSPGILSNKIEIVDPVNIQYTLLDISAGPRVGVQQNFALDPNTRVKLEFDKPLVFRGPPKQEIVNVPTIKRVCSASFLGVCYQYKYIPGFIPTVVTKPGDLITTNVVDIALGDSLEAEFAGAVGNLVKREYYIDDAQLENITAATLDPGLKVQVGCISFLGVGDCLFEEDYKTQGLIDMKMYETTFALGGFDNKIFRDVVALGTGGTGGTAVPEPQTLFLLGMGLILILFRSRCRDTRISQ